MADMGSFQNRVEALDLPEESSFLDNVTFLAEKRDLFERENKDHTSSLWETVQEALKKEFGKSSFDTWFKHLEIASFEKEKFVLSLPTPFLRDWISTHYGSRLKLLLRQIIPLSRNSSILRGTMLTGFEARRFRLNSATL